jgi:hypothetical protein
MTGLQERVEDWAPWAAGLLLATPVLLAYYPPMTDLPLHEGTVGLLLHSGDPTFVPPGLYERNLGEPNQLFHLVGWGLSLVMSTRWAVKLVVAAAVMALPVSATRFASHVGASPLAALVLAPMALGWMFSWGLIANLIGLSVLLATLPVFDRLAAEPTASRGARAIASIVLLYFAHMAMMFVASGVALGLCVLRPWSWRHAAWRLSPLVAGIAITVAQLRWQRQFVTPALRGIGTEWHPVLDKLRHVADIVQPSTDAPVEYAMLSLCALAIASFFWLRTRERRQSASTADASTTGLDRLRARALAHRWETIAVVGFFAFLACPATLNGATLVYQRWFPPAFAILAVVAAPRSLWAPAGRSARIAAMVLPVATILVAGPAFADSDRQYRDLEGLIDRVALGSAVAGIDLSPGDPSRTYGVGPGYARVLATRGGRLVYAFTDSPISPMVLARRYQWNESLTRIGWDPWRFAPSHDLRHFRYVMIRTRDPILKWMVSFAIAEEARLVDEAGDWALFESKLPVAAPTSPEELPAGPLTDTMRERIRQVKDALRDSRPDTQEVEVPPVRAFDVTAPPR